MNNISFKAAMAAIVFLGASPVSVALAQPADSPAAAGEASDSAGYLQRDDVREFLDELSQSSGIDRERLAGMVSRATRQQSIIDAISRPAERTLNWASYRPIFLKQERIEQGREFQQKYADLLARATATYGVPSSIITAIIGVETYYGRITGKYSVLDSLMTLAFDYPPRADFFRKELAEFLTLSDVERWDVHERLGSYAGAMGVPQFISSSYREYAVDFDNDGRRDLFSSMADVIGSVANYFAVHGWKKGAPVAEPWLQVGDVPDAVRELEREALLPEIEPRQVVSLGFDSPGLAAVSANDDPVSVMVLEGAEGEEVWLGYWNFYVITRYNHSRLYAMAVMQLAKSIDPNLE